MTDRELLELAAKAAGVDLKPMQINNVREQGDDRFVGYMTDPEQWSRGWFNPLVDDGDALKLAVKLGLSTLPYPIYNEHERHSVIVKQRRKSDTLRENNPTEVHEVYQGDPYAATRRAIVRAAAEVGKQMENKG